MSRENKIGLGIVGLIAVAIVAHWLDDRCVSAWLRYGVVVPECPAGDVHVSLTENALNLRRGEKAVLQLSGQLLYVVGNAVNVMGTPIKVKDATVELVRDDK